MFQRQLSTLNLKSSMIEKNITKYEPQIDKWWNTLQKSSFYFNKGRCKEPVQEVEETLTKILKEQLISDVPLGAFLSGRTVSVIKT